MLNQHDKAYRYLILHFVVEVGTVVGPVHHGILFLAHVIFIFIIVVFFLFIITLQAVVLVEMS